MANVVLNHPEYCHYKPVFGMQNTSNESGEATSHPIERVPVATASGKDSETVHVVSICGKTFSRRGNRKGHMSSGRCTRRKRAAADDTLDAVVVS